MVRLVVNSGNSIVCVVENAHQIVARYTLPFKLSCYSSPKIMIGPVSYTTFIYQLFFYAAEIPNGPEATCC